MKTELKAQVFHAALEGDVQALAEISRDPQAVRQLQALRAAQPWVQQVARDAAGLQKTGRPASSWTARLADLLRPAVLVPATAFSATLWLAALHGPADTGTHAPELARQHTATRNQSVVGQSLEGQSVEGQAVEHNTDRLFVGDFDHAQPAQSQPASAHKPARHHGDALFNGDFEKNS